MRFRDLIALTKPGVTGLLVFTAMTSGVAASRPSPSLPQLLLLALAGGLAASGSSALNHYLERDIDSQMPRTAGRPLPAGTLTNPTLALIWGLALSGAGVGLAFLTLPAKSAIYITLGILIYVPLYTMYLKRRSVLNIVIGGAAGSCPVLAGWALGGADWPLMPWALAATVFFWTPAHFWAFAIVHKVDYRMAGFPMLPAVIGGDRTPPYILGHAGLAVLASLLAFRGLPLLLVGLAGAIFLLVCVRLWQEPSMGRARSVYFVSNYYLITVFSTLLLVY